VAWSAAALPTHPNVVREIHEDYFRADADVIITNTLSAARHTLEDAGMGDSVDETFAQLLKSLLDPGAALASVMHTGVDDTAFALRILRPRWDRPLGA